MRSNVIHCDLYILKFFSSITIALALIIIFIQALEVILHNKNTSEDATDILLCSKKLNSMQLSVLLYQCSLSENIREDFMDFLKVSHFDNESRSTAQENSNMKISFTIPHKGYYFETLYGVPPGFQEFLDPMINSGNRIYFCCLGLFKLSHMQDCVKSL